MDREPGDRRRYEDPQRRERPLVPPAQSARQSGALGARETSGVQVRLGSRNASARARRKPRGRRTGLVMVGVVAGVAALAAGGVLLWPRGADPGAEVGPQTAPGSSAEVTARMPRSGSAIDVGTADGSQYRIAAVNGGIDEGGATPQQSSPPAGSRFAYIEYVLSNPSKERVLLDFPGDVFLKRTLVAEQARGRCMWQAGVPEDMCTPPTRSEVVRRLAGGALVAGDGSDKYLPPGSSYLVRATVEVPVSEQIRRDDLRLYIWKQLYMADRLAKQAPFPG
ncbi:hypothetical protein [Actinomadura sp. 9N407]|uniref:hypothetical protein n=1 Tax=Actinomadura sp. 9N407 TaxID=3375154 RepID=UPI0037B46F69